MFDSHLSGLDQKISLLENALLLNESLRILLVSGGFHPMRFSNQAAIDAGLSIKYCAMSPTDSRTIDHSTAMTVLYSTYEKFVYDILRDWLTKIPEFFPKYNDIAKEFSKAHRAGISTILYKKDHRRYRHLSAITVLREYADALDAKTPYSLLPEAFFTEDTNLRKDALEALFGRVGFENVWSWIANHPDVVSFMANIRGSQNTVESELEEFIGYRNDVAHGNPGTLLGLKSHLELCKFIKVICVAIAQFVRRKIVDFHVAGKKANVLGAITESLKKGTIAIGTMEECTVNVGESVVLMNDRSCLLANIMNLQNQGQDVKMMKTQKGQEVGIQFSIVIRKGLQIVRVPR